MPDAKDLEKVSQSPALIALVCLVALAFVVWVVVKWVGRMLETKILPLGGDALNAMKEFLSHLLTNQELLKTSQDNAAAIQLKLLDNQQQIKSMNDSTRNHLEKLVVISAEQSKMLAEIAKAGASLLVNVATLQENGKTLDGILVALNKVCKYNEEAIRAAGVCPLHVTEVKLEGKTDGTRPQKS